MSLLGAGARADGPGASTSAQEEAYRLYDEGAAAARAGQREQARSLYSRAWQLHHQWQIAASLGQVELDLGRYRDAAEHLDFAMREVPDAKRENARRRAGPKLDQARARVGALRVSVNVPGAEVLIDGNVVGKAPLAAVVFVEPGAVMVEARLSGYVGARERRTAIPGVEENVDLVLPRMPAPIPAIPGSAEPGARRGPNMAILIGGGATLVVGTVLGAVFAAASNAAATESRKMLEPGPCSGGSCQDQFEALDRKRVTYAYVSMWSFIGAGASLVGTGVYGLVTLQSKPKPEPRVGVWAGPDRIGVTLSAPW